MQDSGQSWVARMRLPGIGEEVQESLWGTGVGGSTRGARGVVGSEARCAARLGCRCI